ncbi:MAG: ABC transporter permease [Cyclobacteriaceae bacterium]
MIKNYFVVAIRNIKRNFSYSAINVFGLSLGISCSLILFMMVKFFTSFDNYHPNGDRVYRVVHSSNVNGREDSTPGVPSPFSDAFRDDVSGLETVLFISGSYNGLFTVEQNGERKIFEQEERFGYTDSTFFSFFARKVVAGNYKTALLEPGQVILSEATARKFFGLADPINQSVRLNNEMDLKVTGVMEDAPDNTNLPFEILISYASIRDVKEADGWNSTSSDDQCYVLLREGVRPEIVNRQFNGFIGKHLGKENAEQSTWWLQPLSDLSYDSRFSNYRYATVSRSSILAMLIVAIFLILTACINFVNLSTAVAVKRSKEVGIRKVLGSQRGQLVLQYLSETAFVTLVAIVVSVGLSELAFIKLNQFLDLNLHIDLGDSTVVLYLIGVGIVVSLISGFYPALLLSGFSPALALKNKITNKSTGGFAMRRGLVVFQFVISQLLIVGTVILLSQMNYLNEKDLGFAKEAVISVSVPENEGVQPKRALKSALNQVPGIAATTLCTTPPSSGSISSTNFLVAGIEDSHRAHVKEGDVDYLRLFQLNLVAGRNLRETDTIASALVNERLVYELGIEEVDEIIGREMTIWGKKIPIVGVVADFHTTSLLREIDPTVIISDLEDYRSIAVRLEPGKYTEAIQGLEKAWTAQYPEYLFSYDFLDRQIAEFYETEQHMSVLLMVFSLIAITIGCLGLYGLISFMANEKEKEIGVRKVLGASVGSIFYIFSKEFMILIVVAFAVAAPLAGYIMDQWLGNFAYRVSFSALMFAAGLMATTIIAFVTVGYRTFKAAYTNPVDTLRSE